eukprot:CAMPEP_0196591124 /NCGR_PEP_ID=MMETSP1081-20130531/68594_1 /TAXON_ID=36882 /ORGANISM="Pyramimonas amylifera, Strain CCMP720" /LENGTH=336 /DNA_ID=CAMNT_0041914393 /DNA_START=33 /DNA_END=1043 /DNA_ORIENTATION=-
MTANTCRKRTILMLQSYMLVWLSLAGRIKPICTGREGDAFVKPHLRERVSGCALIAVYHHSMSSHTKTYKRKPLAHLPLSSPPQPPLIPAMSSASSESSVSSSCSSFSALHVPKGTDQDDMEALSLQRINELLKSNEYEVSQISQSRNNWENRRMKKEYSELFKDESVMNKCLAMQMKTKIDTGHEDRYSSGSVPDSPLNESPKGIECRTSQNLPETIECDTSFEIERIRAATRSFGYEKDDVHLSLKQAEKQLKIVDMSRVKPVTDADQLALHGVGTRSGVQTYLPDSKQDSQEVDSDEDEDDLLSLEERREIFMEMQMRVRMKNRIHIGQESCI